MENPPHMPNMRFPGAESQMDCPTYPGSLCPHFILCEASAPFEASAFPLENFSPIYFIDSLHIAPDFFFLIFLTCPFVRPKIDETTLGHLCALDVLALLGLADLQRNIPKSSFMMSCKVQ